MLFCQKCNGRVFIDRVHCNNGDVELFCIKCGCRWSLGKTSLSAKVFNKIEKKRERAYFGYPDPKLLLS